MHAGKNYGIREFLVWTRRSIYKLLLIAALPTVAYQLLGWKWIGIPWVPIALIGTGAAFIAGFRNTQTYNRMWEARTIWGAIVNSSRSWGIMVRDYVRSGSAAADAQLHKTLVYRHIAWLTALRFQLREPRSWENIKTKSYNIEYSRHYHVPEWESRLEDELQPYLSEEERSYVLARKNRATQLISLQSAQLKQLSEKGWIEPLYYVELENMLKDLYDQQGRSERIKNFPYPRQFASISLFFIRLLALLLPFGLLNEFAKLGEYGVWLTIPFSMLVGWVFTSLEQVGESTENPFEGGANDIPITSMSRTIEIDLREMLGETELPPAVTAQHNILL